jgi:hypothetical protein
MRNLYRIVSSDMTASDVIHWQNPISISISLRLTSGSAPKKNWHNLPPFSIRNLAQTPSPDHPRFTCVCGEVRRGDGAKGVVREMRLDDDRGNGDGSEVELRPDEVCEGMKASGLCTREVNRMSVTVSNQLDSKKDHDERKDHDDTGTSYCFFGYLSLGRSIGSAKVVTGEL